MNPATVIKGEPKYHFRVSSLFSFHVERFRVPEGFWREEGMKCSGPIEDSVWDLKGTVHPKQ